MTPKKHVFLSYYRDNAQEVAKLRDDLIAAGETVWWDQHILGGQDWKQEIRQAMRDAYAVLLCLSREGAGRPMSGVNPEALDAIDLYRQYRTGEVFLIPVRLNDCQIPLIEIDATRTLDRLQTIDLFPPSRRGEGLARLLQALRAAAGHPANGSPPDVAARPPSASYAAGVQSYLDFLKKDTGHIAIRGLQVGTGKAHRFRIDQLYISLTTTLIPDQMRGGSTREVPESEWAGDASRHVELQHALSQPQLVIVGDPGSGKTTFLRRVAYALCQLGHGQQVGRATPVSADPFVQALRDGGFPIVIALSQLQRCIERWRNTPDAPAHDDSPAWLPFYLGHVCGHDFGWGLDRDFFQRQLTDGPCTVLLDGLDEAPDRISRESLSRLIERAATHYDRCRFVVTSRPPAYTEGTVLPAFAHARIDPLSDEAMDTFLARWCEAIYAENAVAARQHADELRQALDARPDIREMVRNPVMLTALAVVHWNERRLPEQRADLYDSILTWLSRSREQRPGRPTAERTVALLGHLALAMQDHPDGRQTQVPQAWAADAIAGRFTDAREPTEAAAAFLRAEELDSGIVVGRGADIRFWHLTFQEFLAAKSIYALRESKQTQLLLSGEKSQQRLYRPEWREVVLLLTGIMCTPEGDRVDSLVEAILDDVFAVPQLADQTPELADQARCLGLLGAICRDLAPYNYRPSDPRYGQLMQNVMAIFTPEGSASVPLQTRVAAAETLGRAGDVRRGVGLRSDRGGLPDILWCDVPGGVARMGDDRSFSVPIAPFRLAAYPVTNTQFRPFVDSDGYRNREYWTKAGWEWKEEAKRSKPAYWDDARWNIGNHPVVGVTWYEAVAYCRWLTRRLRAIGELTDQQEVHLPTEAQWEWAARGPDALQFPWGNEWRENACNNADLGLEHTTAVGLFPTGASCWLGEHAQTCCDLAGNVWEWCATKWRDSYAEPADEDLEGDAVRVIRGGAYYSEQDSVRGGCRLRSPRSSTGTSGVFVSPSNSLVLRLLSPGSCFLYSVFRPRRRRRRASYFFVVWHGVGSGLQNSILAEQSHSMWLAPSSAKIEFCKPDPLSARSVLARSVSLDEDLDQPLASAVYV